jgi:hypothetical protein
MHVISNKELTAELLEYPILDELVVHVLQKDVRWVDLELEP